MRRPTPNHAYSPASHLPPPGVFLTAGQRSEVVRILGLSDQQIRIVELLLRGMRDKQIAAELSLGVGTIRTYLDRVFRRAEVTDRVELILRVVAIAYWNAQPDCQQGR